ncbi:MAG: anthranilate phosphoribosyltransferase [Bacteroidetes bacterium]|nr:anthranilate phosphoribosyltransferase [Bacteroidota bacterium]
MFEILTKLAEHQPLNRSDASHAMEVMLRGEASPEQIAAFLVGLRVKGESVDVLTGLTETMRAFAVPISAPKHALDIVGTGGDRSGSFNISTTTAIVCAGLGVPVAKHGNRSVSSKCGSSDVLEELGIHTALGQKGVEHCLEHAGMAFIFAPYFHPALKHVMPVRKQLGVRTCFNILGPLCNPAAVRRHLIGAFSAEIAESMAHILVNLGSDRVFCVHAHDGLDEISLSGPTTVFSCLDKGTGVKKSTFSPEDVGFKTAPLSAILGGDAKENADILRRVLQNEPGPKTDIVVLNAAFALLAAGHSNSLEDGILWARESLSSGKAAAVLGKLIEVSQQAARLEAN